MQAEADTKSCFDQNVVKFSPLYYLKEIMLVMEKDLLSNLNSAFDTRTGGISR
jgi:hypothetical protein